MRSTFFTRFFANSDLQDVVNVRKTTYNESAMVLIENLGGSKRFSWADGARSKTVSPLGSIGSYARHVDLGTFYSILIIDGEPYSK